MEINKGIETFDDRVDLSRSNPDRMKVGSQGTDRFHLGSEYDTAPLTAVAEVVPPKVEDTPPPKFTHKLANGTTLEAASVEELATLIEKSFVQAPPQVLEFEDKPLYTPIEFRHKDLSLTEQAEILNLWKENPQAAMRKLQEAEYGAPLETIMQNLSRAELRELNRRQEEAGVEFLGECDTYNPTKANAKKLTDYLHAKGKPITKQNLVLSFQQLVAAGDKTLLRKVDEQVVADSADANKDLTEVPPPPVLVPSNQGRPEVQEQVDAAKFAREFASWPLPKQQNYFAKLRRNK